MYIFINDQTQFPENLNNFQTQIFYFKISMQGRIK